VFNELNWNRNILGGRMWKNYYRKSVENIKLESLVQVIETERKLTILDIK
jgi:hypothetical protein